MTGTPVRSASTAMDEVVAAGRLKNSTVTALRSWMFWSIIIPTD